MILLFTYLAMIQSENSNFILCMWKYSFSSLHLKVIVECEQFHDLINRWNSLFPNPVCNNINGMSKQIYFTLFPLYVRLNWHENNFLLTPISKKILFIFREEGRETGREGEKHWCEREKSIGCLFHPSWQGLDPQPRHMPWPGIEPTTLYFSEWCPTYWPTPDRA